MSQQSTRNKELYQEIFSKQSQLENKLLKLITADGFPYYLDRGTLHIAFITACVALCFFICLIFFPEGSIILTGMCLLVISTIILNFSEMVAMNKIKKFETFKNDTLKKIASIDESSN